MSVMGFMRYNKTKKITVQAWFYCAIYRMLIYFFKIKSLERFFGERDQETSKEMDNEKLRIAVRVSRAVNRSADKTPWESKCWVRALAAQTILKKSDISTTLYMGVGNDEKGNMIAHAWLRYGEFYVTGGDGKGYAIVSTFVK